MSRRQRARSFFPAAQDAVFLDHAGGAPISSRVDEAVRQACDEATHRVGADLEGRHRAERARVRSRCARLLGSDADELAFVAHARTGLALVAADVAWEPGDRVVVTEGADHPIWRELRGRGVETLLVPNGATGPSPGRLDEALRHPRARMLALPAVDPLSGARAPLDRLGASCREHGLLLCVDASLGLGALRIDVAACAIDYLVCDAHRYLMALPGCGLLYRARRATRDGLDAQARFESGPRNHLGIVALGAAVDLLLELGPEAIETGVLALAERLTRGLDERGIPPARPHGTDASGLVTFALPGEAPPRTAERLRQGRIYVGQGPRGLCASPHFYNDESEIDALLEAL